MYCKHYDVTIDFYVERISSSYTDRMFCIQINKIHIVKKKQL